MLKRSWRIKSCFLWHPWVCVLLSWQPDSVGELCRVSGLWSEVVLLAASHAAQGWLGVSALYPPHLHGLTQFIYGCLWEGGSSLGEAKNIPSRIRWLHRRGIPRIAILELLARGGVRTARGFPLSKHKAIVYFFGAHDRCAICLLHLAAASGWRVYCACSVRYEPEIASWERLVTQVFWF